MHKGFERAIEALKHLPKQILVAVLFALLIYSEHKLFYRLNRSLVDMVEFKHFVNVGFAYFLFSFIYNKKARHISYLLFALFSLSSNGFIKPTSALRFTLLKYGIFSFSLEK